MSEHRPLRLSVIGSGPVEQVGRHLASTLGVVYLSIPDILKDEQDRDTEIGRIIRTKLINGDVVDHSVLHPAISMILQSEAVKFRGFLLVNFPQTSQDVALLEQLHLSPSCSCVPAYVIKLYRSEHEEKHVLSSTKYDDVGNKLELPLPSEPRRDDDDGDDGEQQPEQIPQNDHKYRVLEPDYMPEALALRMQESMMRTHQVLESMRKDSVIINVFATQRLSDVIRATTSQLEARLDKPLHAVRVSTPRRLLLPNRMDDEAALSYLMSDDADFDSFEREPPLENENDESEIENENDDNDENNEKKSFKKIVQKESQILKPYVHGYITEYDRMLIKQGDDDDVKPSIALGVLGRRKWSSWNRTCPVEYASGHVVPGSTDFAIDYHGYLYLLSNESAVQLFVENPVRYLSVEPKLDKIKIVILGQPRCGKTALAQGLSTAYNAKLLDNDEFQKILEDESLVPPLPAPPAIAPVEEPVDAGKKKKKKKKPAEPTPEELEAIAAAEEQAKRTRQLVHNNNIRAALRSRIGDESFVIVLPKIPDDYLKSILFGEQPVDDDGDGDGDDAVIANDGIKCKDDAVLQRVKTSLADGTGGGDDNLLKKSREWSAFKRRYHEFNEELTLREPEIRSLCDVHGASIHDIPGDLDESDKLGYTRQCVDPFLFTPVLDPESDEYTVPRDGDDDDDDDAVVDDAASEDNDDDHDITLDDEDDDLLEMLTSEVNEEIASGRLQKLREHLALAVDKYKSSSTHAHTNAFGSIPPSDRSAAWGCSGRFCPVSLALNKRLIPGTWLVMYRHHLYACASKKLQTNFRCRPDYYVNLCNNNNLPCPKIVVIGTEGSDYRHVAKTIAEKYDIKYLDVVELDQQINAKLNEQNAQRKQSLIEDVKQLLIGNDKTNGLDRRVTFGAVQEKEADVLEDSMEPTPDVLEHSAEPSPVVEHDDNDNDKDEDDDNGDNINTYDQSWLNTDIKVLSIMIDRIKEPLTRRRSELMTSLIPPDCGWVLVGISKVDLAALSNIGIVPEVCVYMTADVNVMVKQNKIDDDDVDEFISNFENSSRTIQNTASLAHRMGVVVHTVSVGRKPEVALSRVMSILAPRCEFRQSAITSPFIVQSKRVNLMMALGRLSPVSLDCPVSSYHNKPFVQHSTFWPVVVHDSVYLCSDVDCQRTFVNVVPKYRDIIHRNRYVPRVSVVGKPCVGKTSLSRAICRTLGLTYVCLSDAITHCQSLGCAVGVDIDRVMRDGDAPSDDLLLEALYTYVNNVSLCNGWVIDGYPNKSSLIERMNKLGMMPNIVFTLENVSDDDVLSRATADSTPDEAVRFINDDVIKHRLDLDNSERPHIVHTILKTYGGVWTVPANVSQWNLSEYVCSIITETARNQMDLEYSRTQRSPVVLKSIKWTDDVIQSRMSKFKTYCPVRWTDKHELILPIETHYDMQHCVEYDDKLYFMCDDVAVGMFSNNPSKYDLPSNLPERIEARGAPANKGYCPVSLVLGPPEFSKIQENDAPIFKNLIPGLPECGVRYRGNVYVFADVAYREIFMKTPERFWNVPLPSKLPPKKDNIKPNDLPIFGYLEQIVAPVVNQALTTVAMTRLRYPGCSTKATAVRLLGFSLRSYNPFADEIARAQYIHDLREYVHKCRIRKQIIERFGSGLSESSVEMQSLVHEYEQCCDK